jgi:cell division septation protein DedD
VESKLRQRVVGAIVLTSLSIIILPVLLDGSAEDRARVVASIPPAPKIEIKTLRMSDVTKKMQQMERDSAVRLPREVVDETDYSTEDTALDKNSLPIAWSWQLGSFENEENAKKLRATLREAKYRSYILKTKTREGDAFKVLIGPMLEKAAVERIGAEIATQMKIEGNAVRYQIEEDGAQLGG